MQITCDWDSKQVFTNLAEALRELGLAEPSIVRAIPTSTGERLEMADGTRLDVRFDGRVDASPPRE